MTKGSPSRRAAALVVLALPLLLVACVDGEERTAPPADTTTTKPAEPAPAPTTSETTTTTTIDELPTTTPPPTTSPADPIPTTSSPEPRVATTTPPAPRVAPPAQAGDLRFERIVVLDEKSRFAGRANVRNDGPEYLNKVRLRWRVVDSRGATLDGGVLTWPSLAPGETATLHFEGRRDYRQTWRRVVFEVIA